MNIKSVKNFLRGYSLTELLIAIAILSILAGTLAAMLGPFGHRQRLTSDTFMLFTDLKKTQQFAFVKKDSYKYFGLRFYGGLGENNDRQGYKIVRYKPQNNVSSLDMNPQAVPSDLNLSDFTEIQSSVEGDNPEFLENTFFDSLVEIDTSSEFQIDDSIIFTPEGSATSNGYTLLTNTTDDIILSLPNGETKTITIIPLTGYLRIQ